MRRDHHDERDPHEVEINERRVVESRVEPVSDRETESRRVIERVPWSPAQVFALFLGIVSLTLGGFALLQAGLTDLTGHVSVAGLHHTPVLAFIHLGFGVLMLSAGAVPDTNRGTMTFLGGLALVFGVLVTADPSALHEALGVHAIHGMVYIGVGAVSLFLALAAPVIMGTDRTLYRRR